ncbi:ribonuclease D [Hyphomicrobium methylovorum]|uniref:ribonuclease D n=1 Tax=Hyphomicrobium methylovorum TaxID=84 RepID=UPI0015E7BED7|nr:ribonuclease D [Hyphomicrobium methylovorum]MBA2125777.1 ribonuclease D [Hyphomicrobium methylovorum]
MHMITTTSELSALCETLAKSDYVTVDTEFLREQTFWPLLCLIQLAGPEAEAVVDPLTPGLDLAPFYKLMADTSTVKVFHAARQDIEIVFLKSGVVPTPIFDTQIAAMVCGFGDSISYVNLVKKTVGADLDKSSRFTDWSRRPLSAKQLDYALADVTYLRDVYVHLKQMLDKTERTPWLQEEASVLTNPHTYDTDPENAWQRLKLRVKGRKSLAVLIELAAWRERLAQSLDVPRGRVLRDDALYDIANQVPMSVEALGQLRTLSDGFARSQRAKEIIEAVNAGLARDPKTLPKIERNEALSAQASATLELLKVLLKSAAAEHGVAPRIIADSDDLERLATSDEANILALQGWRRALFGEAALKLKRGELALTLVKGEVRAVPAAVAAQ